MDRRRPANISVISDGGAGGLGLQGRSRGDRSPAAPYPLGVPRADDERLQLPWRHLRRTAAIWKTRPSGQLAANPLSPSPASCCAESSSRRSLDVRKGTEPPPPRLSLHRIQTVTLHLAITSLGFANGTLGSSPNLVSTGVTAAKPVSRKGHPRWAPTPLGGIASRAWRTPLDITSQSSHPLGPDKCCSDKCCSGAGVTS